ncbi:MAG: PilZ domain-containing protein [Myxococcales bacterium]|nr:PilZ domain-containing protein [Sphingomicrobium sp.]
MDEVGAEPNSAALTLHSEPIDRRERRPVSLCAFVVREDKSTCEALILDLSYDGCGIETPAPLRLDEAVKLSVLQRGAIDSRVRWYRNGKAGLVFEPEAPSEKKHWPRRSERIATSADVSLRRLGQSSRRVRVTDLSPEGCKVRLPHEPRVGEHLLIKFDGLEVLESEVCWVDGFDVGLHFERSFHPAVFALLAERLKSINE